MIAEITRTLGIRPAQVQSALSLFAQGNTIPFIARYRKEATGTLDEVQLRCIQEQYEYEQALASRKETVRQSIMDQGCWNDDLARSLEAARQLQDVEDLYLPYKPKKRTKASMARDAGLEPLADCFASQDPKGPAPEDAALSFLSDDVPTVEDAIQGAANILAERFSERADFRRHLRRELWQQARLTCSLQVEEDQAGPMLTYADFSERVARIPSYRILAINRGENEKKLKVTLKEPADRHIAMLCQLVITRPSPYDQILRDAAADSYKRLISPQMEREIRNELTAQAEKEAIDVFAENLRQLLLAPPLGQKRVMGIDPGFRTGCKVVCLDAQGNLVHNENIYPHPPVDKKTEAASKLRKMIEAYKIEAIAIGNGTASRETENFVTHQQFDRNVQVFVVSEQGASIYSASKTARDEFPDYDVTVRGAVSIARRLMDPLAELVKIAPKPIGVGQYQHDVDQTKLKKSLDQTVENCVNQVGVNLNTASSHLLTYISGLGPQLAQNIVAYRAANGAFASRKELMKVPRMGAKAFEQCAGFLRIAGGENPLDNTAVHPESYGIVQQMAKDLSCTVPQLIADKSLRTRIEMEKYITPTVGLPTLKDILQELDKSGRDPRDTIQVFEFDRNVRTINDLREGMTLPGIVSNITNFGAFVDIGIKENGLVHLSQLANRFITDPTEVVSIHQHVTVKVLSIDLERKRIQLTMKEE